MPNVEICANAGKFGANCAHTISTDTRWIGPNAWEKESIGQLCMTAESYGKIKTAILKLCDKSGACNEEAIKNISKIDGNIQGVSQPNSTPGNLAK